MKKNYQAPELSADFEPTSILLDLSDEIEIEVE